MRERRKHKRFPTLSLIKSVEISSPNLNLKSSMPAIMFNISAGGLAFITFYPFPVNSIIVFNLELGDISLKNVKGRVVRIEEKKSTFLIGVEFLNLSKRIRKKIEEMAEDYIDCEARILRREEIICFPESCSYYPLCCKKEKKEIKINSFVHAH